MLDTYGVKCYFICATHDCVETLSNPFTMQLSIPSSPVTVMDKGARALVLGGSLWIRRESLGPLTQSGTYDLVCDVSVSSVSVNGNAYTTLRVDRVLTAKPVRV